MAVDSSIKIKKYQITNIETHFENMVLGQNVISVEPNAIVQQKIKEDEPDQLVELSLKFFNDQTHLLVFSITTKAKMIFPEDSNNCDDSTLNLEAIGLLYDITRDAVSKISNISNVNFLNLPEFSDFCRLEE